MILVKSALTKKEQLQILFLLDELKEKDPYRDFYITKKRDRLFIKENPDVLFKNLKKGDLVAFSDKGLAVILGFSDKSERKYLRVLAEDAKTIKDLLTVLSWNYNLELYIKIKRNNPIKEVLFEQGFFYFKGRGENEMLLKRNKRELETISKEIKERE